MLWDLLEWWWETLPARGDRGPGAAQRLVLRQASVDTANGDVVQATPLDAESLDEMFSGRNGIKGPAVLALDASRYIVRTLSPVKLPSSRARAMAALDLASATPFQPEDVYCLALKPAIRSNLGPTTYAIVKRSLLDPVLERLRSGSASLAGVVMLPRDEQEAPVWKVSPADVARLAGKSSGQRRMTLVAASAVLAAVVGTVFHAQWTYAAAQTSIDEILPPLEVKARKIRDELNRRAARVAEISALRRNLSTQRPMSEVLEEVSRVLPDSAYLTDLTVRNGDASLIGFSGSASSIIAPIEGSPMFEGAEFTSPVVRTPGYDGERFEIKLRVLNR